MIASDELAVWLERLENVVETSSGWRASCPMDGHAHGDRDRSLSITAGHTKPVVVRCHTFPDEHTFEGIRDRLRVEPTGNANGTWTPPPSLPPSMSLPQPWELDKWAKRLQRDDLALAEVLGRKGWPADKLAELGIGLARDNRLMIPVRDLGGALVNVLAYLPGAKANKVRAEQGCPRTPFYWLPERDDGPVFVVEGEADGVSLACLGLSVIGAPGAGSKPQAQWLEPLRGRVAIVCFDADKPGRQGAQRWAQAAHEVAAEVRIFDIASVRS